MSDDADRRPRRDHSTALWAGLTTLFTNLAAINAVALLGDESDPRVTAIAATITALVVAAGVYSKQRWDDAKSTHFVVEEFDCHDGTKVAKRDYNGLEYLCRVFLEPLRDEVRARPRQLAASERRPTTARSAGRRRATTSTRSTTATIRPPTSRAPAAIRAAGTRRPTPSARERGGKGGLGLYPSFVHIDIRDTQANWKG
jgi:hypothetical protein